MEQLEHSKFQQEIQRGQQGFVFEREGITVAKRVAPQEINGWRNRGYSLVVICFGIQPPWTDPGIYQKCLLAGAMTEFNRKQWERMLLSFDRTENMAVALTGGDMNLAKQILGHSRPVGLLPMYFEAFGQSQPFKRQLKRLLNKM